VKKDTEAYCSSKVKMEHIYNHIKHLSHFFLSLAFYCFKRVELCAWDRCTKTAISHCFAWLLAFMGAFNEFGSFYFI